MTLVIGMWSWGFLIGPVLSGALADPLTQYSQPCRFLSSTGTLYNFLADFPFVLPNLLGTFLCIATCLALSTFVPESLKDAHSITDLPQHVLGWCSTLWRRIIITEGRQIVPTTESHDSVNHNQKDDKTPSMSDILTRPTTRALLFVYWCHCFVVLTHDEVFPLLAMSQRAGLGLAERQIGQVLSVCGLNFSVTQYHIYERVHQHYGLMGTLRVGALCAAPMYILIPVVVYWQQNSASNDDLSWPVFVFLCLVLAASKVASLMVFSSISVAINRSVPPSCTATTNGVSMLGGSISKATGPLLMGVLAAAVLPWQAGSFILYGILCVMGCGVAYAACRYLPTNEDELGHDHQILLDSDGKSEIINKSIKEGYDDSVSDSEEGSESSSWSDEEEIAAGESGEVV